MLEKGCAKIKISGIQQHDTNHFFYIWLHVLTQISSRRFRGVREGSEDRTMNCSRYWRTVSRVSAHVTVALYFSPACVTLAQVWYEFLSFSVQFTRSNFVVTCFTLIVTTFVSAWFSTCYTVLFSVDREKSFDSPRVRRFEEQTAQIENSENFPSAESLSTTAQWLSWGLSFRRELTLSKQVSVSHAWKSHGVDMQGDACWRYCTTFVRCNVGGACGFWLGWRFVWKEEHDRGDREKRLTFVATHVMFAVTKRRSWASTPLCSEKRARVWEFNHIVKIGWPKFQYNSTVACQ